MDGKLKELKERINASKCEVEKLQKKLLEQIKDEIQTYNDTNPAKLLVLLELKKESMLQCKIEVAEEKKKRDIRDLFICRYDDAQVDLFKQEKVVLDASEFYTEAALYCNDEKERMGAYVKRRDIEDGEKWAPKGTILIENDGSICRVNCTIYETARFDTLRYKMKKEGILDHYTAGVASDWEIEEVLTYARTFFRIEKPKEKVKK